MRHETRAIALAYDVLDYLLLRNNGTESGYVVAVLIFDEVFEDFVIVTDACVAAVRVGACHQGPGGGDFLGPVVA